MLPECASGRRGGGEEVTPCTAAGSREDRGRKRRPEMVKWGGPKKKQTAISIYKLKFYVFLKLGIFPGSNDAQGHNDIFAVDKIPYISQVRLHSRITDCEIMYASVLVRCMHKTN